MPTSKLWRGRYEYMQRIARIRAIEIGELKPKIVDLEAKLADAVEVLEAFADNAHWRVATRGVWWTHTPWPNEDAKECLDRIREGGE